MRRIRAKIWLWWYFRNRCCYICGSRGSEELQLREVKVWPCAKHAKQVSQELRDLTARYKIGDKLQIVEGDKYGKYDIVVEIIEHCGFRRYKVQNPANGEVSTVEEYQLRY